MADSGLDDFFAKKDKSKKKVAKFTTNDILEKQTEKPRAKKIKKNKDTREKSAQQGSTTTSAKNAKKETEEDEWHDYEDEEKKDFSDLKIQNLQIGSKDDDDDTDRPGLGAGSDDEEGGGRDRRDGTSGPWNKANAKTHVPNVTVVVEKPKPVQEAPPEEASRPSGKYIPPGVRRAMESGTSGGALPAFKGYGRRRRKAPDVMSEEDFPTLGGASDTAGDGGSSVNSTKFEEVRGGGRKTDDPHAHSQKLEIGNKFDVLSGPGAES